MDLAGVVVPSKIKIKLGSFELEYEVDEAVSKDALIEIVEKLSKMLPKEALREPHKPKPHESAGEPPIPKGGMTTSTIAQKLSVNTGPGLAKAALARLFLYGGKETSKRKEILAEMKSAKTFYSDG